MIETLRDYIAQCPYLDEFTALNVDYLVDKVKAYSLNESAGYNPITSEDIIGNQNRQFLFTLDCKFHWNEEVQNNIENSEFFESFSEWLEEKNRNEDFPEIEDGSPFFIGATTNGFIFATNSDEAIYRVQCKLEYRKEV